MNDLLNKLSSYHLFNYLLPGCLFAIAATKITHRDFVQQNVILGFFLYYFYGLVISRIGSLIVEPLLKSVKFLKFASYPQFIAACKADPKIDVLSESNNMYRTICALFLVLAGTYGYSHIESAYPSLKRFDVAASMVILLVMFLFSYRKQTSYIAKRVAANQEAA